MTFAEWVNSKYNVDGIETIYNSDYGTDLVISKTGNFLSTNSTATIYISTDIYASSTIVAGKAYYFNAKCFVAGTKVLMASGEYKNIEDIKVGDYVMSLDEETKEYIKQEVLFTHENNVEKEIVRVTMNDGTKIEMTTGHPLTY